MQLLGAVAPGSVFGKSDELILVLVVAMMPSCPGILVGSLSEDVVTLSEL